MGLDILGYYQLSRSPHGKTPGYHRIFAICFPPTRLNLQIFLVQIHFSDMFGDLRIQVFWHFLEKNIQLEYRSKEINQTNSILALRSEVLDSWMSWCWCRRIALESETSGLDCGLFQSWCFLLVRKVHIENWIVQE